MKDIRIDKENKMFLWRKLIGYNVFKPNSVFILLYIVGSIE